VASGQECCPLRLHNLVIKTMASVKLEITSSITKECLLASIVSTTIVFDGSSSEREKSYINKTLTITSNSL